MTNRRLAGSERRRRLFLLLIALLGLNALVPAGHMAAPGEGGGIAILPCPETHPLAHAFNAASDTQAASAHDRMGHRAADGDDGPAAAAQTKSDCAFAGLSPAGTLPDAGNAFSEPAVGSAAPERRLVTLAIRSGRHIRPPLRAPPRLI